MPIEVEIRSFISKEKYDELLDFFKKNAKFIKKENEETEYYADHGSVRLRKNETSAKIIIKSGDIHDEAREEHEISISYKDFQLYQEMFKKLNIPKKIRWERIKNTFEWDGITAELGFSKGYGYIIELEKITTEDKKEEALKELKEKMALIKIPITPKEEFEKAYENYKNNWQILLKDNNQ